MAALVDSGEGDADEGADRRIAMSVRAADEALAQAGLRLGGPRAGVFVGAESGRASFRVIASLTRSAIRGGRFDERAFHEAAGALVDRLDTAALSPATVAARLAARLGAEGPVRTLSLACSSGAAALVEATRAIRLGCCDAALAGGVGADGDALMIAGFGMLGALSAKGRSAPFDLRRDGFVVGEGAAFAVLSCERGDAAIEVAGAARTLDAHHLTAPDPAGLGAERCMRAALTEASLAAVDHVQAHGTSTPLNDAVEAAALRRVLGAGLDAASVSSVKGALGHWIAGAGALGFVCACHAILTGRVLPTAGLEVPDPALPLPHVLGRALERRVDTALVNAFAFGGANSCLVIRRCSDSPAPSA